MLCQLSNEDPYVGNRPIYRVHLYPNIWVFIAQLVEHCSAEAIVSNPVDARTIYFRAKILTTMTTTTMISTQFHSLPGCDISTRLLAQASVKSVGRAQIIDHSPVWRVRFSLLRNYLNCEINVFYIPFCRENP